MTSQALGDYSVKDKIFLVAGGGSGISLAFIRLAHSAGAKIIIADLALTDDAAKLIASAGKEIVFQKTDVTDWTALKACFELSLTHFSDVPDVVVNGAGIFEPQWFSFWIDEEDQRYRSVDINVSAVIKVSRMAIKAMISHRKKGIIVNISSMAGISADILYSPMYVATKHGVVGLTRSLGPLDIFEGIKCVAICPGIVNTPLWTPDKAFLMDSYDTHYIMTSEDVATAMMDLVQSSKYPGGTALQIDGDQEKKMPVTKIAPKHGTRDTPENLLEIMKSGFQHPLFALPKSALDKDRETPWPA